MKISRTIDECFNLIRNGANIKQGLIDGGYPITRIETIANNKFNRDRMGYAGINDLEKYSNYILEDEDLLMSHINSLQYLGRTVMYSKQGDEVIIHGMNLLILKANREIVLPAYAQYYFRSQTFKEQLARITKKSVNQASFAVSDLKKLQFALPEIEEQNSIVSILDKTLDIIEKRKRELQSLDDLIKARFVEMFGDPNLAYSKENWIKIADIGNVVGGSTPKTDKEEFWDGEYRWLTPAEIVSGSGYIYDSVRKITKAGAESCSLQEMPIGTVILSSRAPIGKVAIAGNTFYCNQGFKNIICNDKVNPVYLYSLLLFNTNYLNSLGRGATFKEISKSIVENIKIPLPDIYNQNQFADFVTQINKSKVVS